MILTDAPGFSLEELLAVIAAGYAGGKAVYEAAKWLLRKIAGKS